MTSRAGPTGGEGIRVLLVEDDDTDARLAELALDDERVGAFTMRRAASLRRALEMLAVEPYDLVLLDLGLPDAGELDGVGALARIEDAPPIVVLTGRGEHDLAVAAIRAGAQDFVVKGEPDRNPLARAVGHALEREWAARRQRDRDQGYYEVMAEPAGTRVSARLLDAAPLREAAPEAFAALLARYDEVLAAAWRRRRFDVQEDVSGPLRSIAERLCSLAAGPRDAVDLHRDALAAQPAERPPAAARGFTDEARYVLLELMGMLAEGYRRSSWRRA
ncbi:MAG: response regulator [Thermoleophilia bacterium]|nr:response regulator [Thermoleophilia bacterium]